MSRHFKVADTVRILLVSAALSGLSLTAFAKSPSVQAEVHVGGGGGGVPYPHCAGDVVTQNPNKFSCWVDVTPEPIDDIVSENNEPVYGLIVLIGPCGPKDYWNGRITKTTRVVGDRTYETTTCRHVD